MARAAWSPGPGGGRRLEVTASSCGFPADFVGLRAGVRVIAEMETQKLSFEDFKNIVVERLGCEPEQVTMDASFQEDLNADSLDLVELIYAFEENTGLEIPDEDAEKITTVGQAWEYIQEKAGS
jgi:acyl carrier protein